MEWSSHPELEPVVGNLVRNSGFPSRQLYGRWPLAHSVSGPVAMGADYNLELPTLLAPISSIISQHCPSRTAVSFRLDLSTLTPN